MPEGSYSMIDYATLGPVVYCDVARCASTLHIPLDSIPSVACDKAQWTVISTSTGFYHYCTHHATEEARSADLPVLPSCNWCHADVPKKLLDSALQGRQVKCSNCGKDPFGRTNPDLCPNGPCWACKR